MTTETIETLNTKTVAQLKDILRARKIVGMFKKPKAVIIKAIVDAATSASVASAKPAIKSKAAVPTKITAAKFNMSSVMTKPNAKPGDKTTTTIQVSCGANSADFPVTGKPVGAVQEFLKEVLNIDRLAEGQVAGKPVGSDYILKEGDVLEFIKPAGRKGADETATSLDKLTVVGLKDILRARKIVGYFKAGKAGIIAAILADTAAKADFPSTAPAAVKAKNAVPTKITAAKFNMTSVMTKPNAKVGDKTTTTIQVSCGANSSDFPVVGKPVGAVQEFLKEVLNIDRLAEGQVAGKPVGSDYVLAEGDVLEFIKPAGRKG